MGRPYETMRVLSVILIGFLIILPIWAQRRRNWDDINREETATTTRKPPPPPPPRKDIGEFPFNRGETPIFNFDQGDEAFLNTIPDLIDGLHDMTRYVQEQTKLPQMYSKIFLNCPDCKP